MARQLFDRFPIKAYFSNAEEMLDKTRPHVVHIATPPQTHLHLARLCLERGCHIYVEKPFAVDANQAEQIIHDAKQYGRKVTVGNDGQFTHAAIRSRKLIQHGFLGGDPVHMESFYCFELTGTYAAALLGDNKHWIRQLPGQLLHNIISHGIVRIAEYLKSEKPTVIAHGSTSSQLRSLNHENLIDELRVIIADDGHCTGYFTFSSQMRPSLHQFRLYGPRNGLVLDDDEHSVIKLYGRRYKSYAEKFIPPANLAAQSLGNLGRNVKLFLKRDFHMKSGMRHLIQAFYRSITEDTPLPISYRDIILTCRIMDAIFTQLDDKGIFLSNMRPGPSKLEMAGRAHSG
jgi:predicted dehydrogenase